MSDILATVSNVTKLFDTLDKPAINNLSLDIKKGKILGLVGPDGAGKTTLIRMIAGLLLPETGKIEVAGFDTRTNLNDIKDSIGYMPQKFGLYEDLSIEENLNFYAKLQNVSDVKATVDSLLDFTLLTPFKDRLTGKLSGGMKQKVGIAAALVKKPKLLLLDEPGVGVDPIAREDLWRVVKDMVKDGMGVIWSTSYLDEAELCDEVALFNEGNILYNGSPREAIDKVEGRVFYIENQDFSRRDKLRELLNNSEIMDASIEGKHTKIFVKKDADMSKISDRCIPIKSRFEDVFMDYLGGVHNGESLLADNTKLQSLENMKYIIEGKGLTKQFGNFIATNDVTFHIKPGEVFGFLGPNGSGKSTTFKMLCGLLTPTKGEAKVVGFDLKNAGIMAKNKIGYMSQKFALYEYLKVVDNLKFFAGVYGLSSKEEKIKIKLMEEVFELGSYMNAITGSLPLGFKQRLALACATMHEPEVLFLDEPTSGIDPIARREFWNHINGLARRGVTIMATTHFMDEAEYCDNISIIYRGKNVAEGSPDEIKKLVDDIYDEPTLQDAFVEIVKREDKKEDDRFI